VGTVRDALQLPDMRRIELGYGLSITGELAGTVALVVYALGAGGAALVAAYAASRTVAGMGVTLVLTGLTNRLRRDRLLRWSTGIRMLLLAGAALLAASGQAPRSSRPAPPVRRSRAPIARCRPPCCPGWCARRPSSPRPMPSPP
jgi:hypothetical protein